jgi:hypothetical protein
MVSPSPSQSTMLRSITIANTAALSTSTSTKNRQSDGVQRSGGGEVFGEINVNSRRSLIPTVHGSFLGSAEYNCAVLSELIPVQG